MAVVGQPHTRAGGYPLVDRRPKGEVMAVLPSTPDLEQLRRQAKELLASAKEGNPSALARIESVSPRLILS